MLIFEYVQYNVYKKVFKRQDNLMLNFYINLRIFIRGINYEKEYEKILRTNRN